MHGKEQQVRRPTETVQPSGSSEETSFHPEGTESNLESNVLPVPTTIYLCKLCGDEFPTEENLYSHTEIEHESL